MSSTQMSSDNATRVPRAGIADMKLEVVVVPSFASFSDPDGNGWLLQEVKTRAPGW